MSDPQAKGQINAVIFWNVAFVALECPLLVVKRTHSLAAPHVSSQSTPVFLPGESQGLGSLVGFRLWGRTESDMTEAT